MTDTQYEKYAEFKSWEAIGFGVYTPDEAAFFEAEIGVAKLPNRQSKILEIGFGNGKLLSWAHANGYGVTGYEVQNVLISRAKEAGFTTCIDMAALENCSFDKIVALDVFEHVSFKDLTTMLLTVRRLLTVDGQLIARFPNGDSSFSMTIFNKDHTHINWMGSGKISDLMKHCGFNLYILRAPRDPATSLLKGARKKLKATLMKAHLLFVKAVYLGGSAPTTLHANYLLVATKSG